MPRCPPAAASESTLAEYGGICRGLCTYAVKRSAVMRIGTRRVPGPAVAVVAVAGVAAVAQVQIFARLRVPGGALRWALRLMRTTQPARTDQPEEPRKRENTKSHVLSSPHCRVGPDP